MLSLSPERVQTSPGYHVTWKHRPWRARRAGGGGVFTQLPNHRLTGNARCLIVGFRLNMSFVCTSGSKAHTHLHLKKPWFYVYMLHQQEHVSSNQPAHRFHAQPQDIKSSSTSPTHPNQIHSFPTVQIHETKPKKEKKSPKVPLHSINPTPNTYKNKSECLINMTLIH